MVKASSSESSDMGSNAEGCVENKHTIMASGAAEYIKLSLQVSALLAGHAIPWGDKALKSCCSPTLSTHPPPSSGPARGRAGGKPCSGRAAAGRRPVSLRLRVSLEVLRLVIYTEHEV